MDKLPYIWKKAKPILIVIIVIAVILIFDSYYNKQKQEYEIKSYHDAYDEGYSDGHGAGYDEGKQYAIDEYGSYDNGYAKGYADALSVIYDELSYDYGYLSGYEDAVDLNTYSFESIELSALSDLEKENHWIADGYDDGYSDGTVTDDTESTSSSLQPIYPDGQSHTNLVPNYPMEPVESSFIDSIGYVNGDLFIKFKTGGTYQYYNVESYVYDFLMSADSKGSYFNENIKGVYEYKKIGE